jgi:hypothetical protein
MAQASTTVGEGLGAAVVAVGWDGLKLDRGQSVR